MSKLEFRAYNDNDFVSCVGSVVSKKYLKKYLNKGFIYRLLKQLRVYQTSFYVLELDAVEVVGAIAIRKKFDMKILKYTYWIYGVEIRADRQRRGYGGILISNVLRMLKEQGVKSVFLKVDKHNLSALGLYEKFNFSVVKQMPNEFILEAKTSN